MTIFWRIFRMDIEVLDYGQEGNGTFVPDDKFYQEVCLCLKNGWSLDLEEKLVLDLMLSGV